MAIRDRRPFKERAADTISALGEFLMSNADNIVGDVSRVTGIEISMKIESDGINTRMPEIKVLHSYFDRKVAEARMGIRHEE